MGSEFSYQILNEDEVSNLKQVVLDSYRALAREYYDKYCSKYGIEKENKGLLKSFWYVVYFSNAYGEDAEQNLQFVVDECQTPAAARVFAYRLMRKNEDTIRILRRCEQLGVEKRKQSLLSPSNLFEKNDRVFIEIPPANSRALQCQNLVDWFNSYLPQDEDKFQLRQIPQVISEKSANGVKIERNVFDYRLITGKQEKKVGKFLTSIASDLKKMIEVLEENPSLKDAFLKFLNSQTKFDKKAFFEFKAKMKCKNLYLSDSVVFYQLKSIAHQDNFVMNERLVSLDKSFLGELKTIMLRYEREAGILQEIETKKLSENESKAVADMIILSIRPMDIARKSTFTSWTSCNDVNGRFGSDYALKYIPDEISAYSIVAYGVNKKNPSKPLCRCLINPYVNASSLDAGDKFYACDRMYGEIIPTLRLTLEDVIKNELNKNFSGTGVYDFKGHAPENCPQHLVFYEGKRVQDLDVFMEMMKKEFGSEYKYTELPDGRYFFDDFELFPDEDVDFRGAEIENLRITRLTPGINLGQGIQAKTVEVRKIFSEKMPNNLTMETLIFDDASDRAHPEERVHLPHNITVDELWIKSMHIDEIPNDLNVKCLFMDTVVSGSYLVNPLKNLKTFNGATVKEFSSNAGMTKELLSTLNVTDCLSLSNYRSEILPDNVNAKAISLTKSAIKKLPDGFKVDDMDVSESQIEALPNGFEVSGFFYAIDCKKLKHIGSNFKCLGTAIFDNTNLASFPADMQVHTLSLSENSLLKQIPENVNVEHLEISDFSGFIHYSKYYKSIKLDNCLPLIHPSIPNEIIKGLTSEEIMRSKQEYARREKLKINKSKQNDNR